MRRSVRNRSRLFFLSRIFLMKPRKYCQYITKEGSWSEGQRFVELLARQFARANKSLCRDKYWRTSRRRPLCLARAGDLHAGPNHLQAPANRICMSLRSQIELLFSPARAPEFGRRLDGRRLRGFFRERGEGVGEKSLKEYPISLSKSQVSSVWIL